MFEALGLERKPVQRQHALICRRLPGAGQPSQLFSFGARHAEGEVVMQAGGRQGEKNVEAGLLPVDAVHQGLAHLIAEIALGEAYRPQRPLLPDQLFALHQAVKRDKPTSDLRIVNAVVKLRHDTEQVAQRAAVALHRDIGGQRTGGNGLAQRRKLLQALQGICDPLAEGAAGHQRRTEGLEQRLKMIVHQCAAGFTLQGIQRAL